MSIANNIDRPRPIFLNLSPTYQGMSDLSPYTAYYHTHKQQGISAGTWEVTLAQAPNTESKISRSDFQDIVYQSIRPMDTVIIGSEERGLNKIYEPQHFMFGFVDNVYRTISFVDGQLAKSVTVVGRDGTKPFLVDNIANAPELSIDPNLQKLFQENISVLQFLDYLRGQDDEGKKNIFYDSYLPQVFYWIIKNTPSMRITLDYFEGREQSPIDFFKMYLFARAEDKVFSEQMNMYAGSVMNYFSNLIDTQFYDLWVDTLPYNAPANTEGKTRPCLILRPKPYDYSWETTNSQGEPLLHRYVELDPKNPTTAVIPNANPYTWNNFLHPITIDPVHLTVAEDIRKMNLGVSDREVFSLFKVGGSKDLIATATQGKYGFAFPLLDAGIIKTYGLRELITESKLIPSATDALSQLFDFGEDAELQREEREKFAKAWGIPFLKAKGATPKLGDAVTAVEDSKFDKLADIRYSKVLTTEKRDRLWRWNRYNQLLESGTIETKGHQVFVGCKVIIDDLASRGLFDTAARERKSNKGLEYLCQSVDQTGGWGTQRVTSLALNRGANMTDLETYFRQRQFDKAASPENLIFTRNTDSK